MTLNLVQLEFEFVNTIEPDTSGCTFSPGLETWPTNALIAYERDLTAQLEYFDVHDDPAIYRVTQTHFDAVSSELLKRVGITHEIPTL